MNATTKIKVLSGPVDGLGNVFGWFKPGISIAAGRFVLVTDGEYCNGGHGPSLAVDRVFATREAAEAAISSIPVDRT